MPFVQIALLRGKPAAVRRAIADSVHEALIDAFAIPKDDRFQVIHELDADNLIFPSSYLGIAHTDDIVYVHVTARSGRSLEKKQRLFSLAAQLINRRTGIAQDDVIIVLSENTADGWSFGRGQAQYVAAA